MLDPRAGSVGDEWYRPHVDTENDKEVDLDEESVATVAKILEIEAQESGHDGGYNRESNTLVDSRCVASSRSRDLWAAAPCPQLAPDLCRSLTRRAVARVASSAARCVG